MENHLEIAENNYSIKNNLLFPYHETGYCCSLADSLSDTAHCHDYYELTYCITGLTTYVINDKQYEFPENSIFIIPPNTTHYFINFDAASTLTICINTANFNKLGDAFSLMNKPYFEATDEPLFLKLPTSEIYFFRNLYNHIIICQPLEQTPYLTLFVSRALSCKTQHTLDQQPIPNAFLNAVSEMKKLENAREGISAFLRLTSFSHAHLCRLSKKYLKMTPHEYINSIRLQHAHSMIINECIKYEEVAELVGFSSYPHFCKLFQEHFHISPSKLRNENT